MFYLKGRCKPKYSCSRFHLANCFTWYRIFCWLFIFSQEYFFVILAFRSLVSNHCFTIKNPHLFSHKWAWKYFYTIPGNILDTVSLLCQNSVRANSLTLSRLLDHTNKKTNNAVAIIIDYYKKYTQLLNKIDKPCDNTNYKEMLSACWLFSVFSLFLG